MTTIPKAAYRCASLGEGIGRRIDGARPIGAAQGGKTLALPEEIGRAVHDEAHRLLLEQRPLAVPAKLRGASELGPPTAPAQQLNEKLELAAKLASL